MTPSRAPHMSISMKIDVSLCAGGVPRSTPSPRLSMRPSETSFLAALPKCPRGACLVASGAELSAKSVPAAVPCANTNPSSVAVPQQNQVTATAAAKKHFETNEQAKDTEGTNSIASTAPLLSAPNEVPQRTQAKNDEGTTTHLPPAAAAPIAPSVSSPAPTVGPAASAPSRPMLTISSALCNENFNLKRNRFHPGASTHRPEKASSSGDSDVNPANKARYQERFAPLRPTNRAGIEGLQQRQDQQQQAPSAQALAIVEPPSWAVSAPGEARLEPVGESVGVQGSVNLSARAVLRIGRSPASDVQLLHVTSSRRHALLFHHPNGSCYVVDCGSAHGTYVNGVRVPSAADGAIGSNGAVIPRRIRRGAIVRFGGPGAPSFVLKAFSTEFETLVRDLPGVDAEAEAPSSDEDSMDELLSGFPSPSRVTATELNSKDYDEGRKSGLRRVVSKEGEEGTPMDSPRPTLPLDSTPVDLAVSEASLVRLNTRINALGGESRLPTDTGRRLARRASKQLFKAIRPQSKPKRSRALETENAAKAKRAKTAGTSVGAQTEVQLPPSPLSPKLASFPALVSPVVAAKLLLSPEHLRRAPPPPMFLAPAPTPVELRDTLTHASSELFANSSSLSTCPKNLLIPSTKELKSKTRHSLVRKDTAPAAKARRVVFSDEAPQMFYPASITPDQHPSF